MRSVAIMVLLMLHAPALMASKAELQISHIEIRDRNYKTQIRFHYQVTRCDFEGSLQLRIHLRDRRIAKDKVWLPPACGEYEQILNDIPTTARFVVVLFDREGRRQDCVWLN